MLRILLAAVVTTLALGACGGSAAAPDEVVEGWVEALTVGSDEDAAAFFADKPLFIQGFLPTIPQTRQGIVNWHANLDCGGEITGMRVEGERVTATLHSRIARATAVRRPATYRGWSSTSKTG